MQTDLPFYDSIEDALKAAVVALGGSKAVGTLLFPDKSFEAATRYLQDCLNPARNEKLEYTQVMLILKKAREAGVHGPFSWLAAECGYDALPITKDEQTSRLINSIESASKALSAAMAMLNKHQGGAA
jgi:hypothetical protein